MSEEPELHEAERIPAPPRPAGAGARPAARARAALLVALAADAIQWLALPAFAPGITSPLNNVLDVVVAVVMIRLLGWHWAFLPTFVVELVPFVDLVPTWTLAVLLVGRLRGGR